MQRLAPYYDEYGVRDTAGTAAPSRAPFNAEHAAMVAEFTPAVVSFHFGLPEPELLARVKASGAKVFASATTVAEARWLADYGADAIIAQGWRPVAIAAISSRAISACSGAPLACCHR